MRMMPDFASPKNSRISASVAVPFMRMKIVQGFRFVLLEVGVRAPVLASGDLISSTVAVAVVGDEASGFTSRSPFSRSFLSFLSFFLAFSFSDFSALGKAVPLTFGDNALALAGVAGFERITVFDCVVDPAAAAADADLEGVGVTGFEAGAVVGCEVTL